MNQKEKRLLEEIKKDIKALEKRKDLSAFGEGQRILIKQLESI